MVSLDNAGEGLGEMLVSAKMKEMVLTDMVEGEGWKGKGKAPLQSEMPVTLRHKLLLTVQAASSLNNNTSTHTTLEDSEPPSLTSIYSQDIPVCLGPTKHKQALAEAPPCLPGNEEGYEDHISALTYSLLNVTKNCALKGDLPGILKMIELIHLDFEHKALARTSSSTSPPIIDEERIICPPDPNQGPVLLLGQHRLTKSAHLRVPRV
ncbi:hypothetical protein DACRYDRAFT_110425 [Dacryopinax primogenitus]|uniref:Uncharacterized protein n=1 Tax=Dacryopinax primogenitus (strain DJM 731) TaxID=1858805 RepID=M5FZX0_DACPD|nr:uncharacterized protein DACRYDRAFT_110425 [Dacryopinax primogenitus]EJT99106.1 hypothetical protein DACRYDRAFT_110425 [Dacryopinax primogenitus]